MNGMLGVAEARRRFAEILDRALEGENVVVTRNGEPVAAIVPFLADPGPVDRPLGLAAFAGAMASREGLEEAVAGVVATRSVARERESRVVE